MPVHPPQILLIGTTIPPNSPPSCFPQVPLPPLRPCPPGTGIDMPALHWAHSRFHRCAFCPIPKRQLGGRTILRKERLNGVSRLPRRKSGTIGFMPIVPLSLSQSASRALHPHIIRLEQAQPMAGITESINSPSRENQRPSSQRQLIQNPGESGNRHAVIGDGNALPPGAFDAVQNIFAVEHTGPAVDD